MTPLGQSGPITRYLNSILSHDLSAIQAVAYCIQHTVMANAGTVELKSPQAPGVDLVIHLCSGFAYQKLS